MRRDNSTNSINSSNQTPDWQWFLVNYHQPCAGVVGYRHCHHRPPRRRSNVDSSHRNSWRCNCW